MYITIDDALRTRIKREAHDYNPSTSITGGRRKEIAKAGEIVVETYLRGKLINDYNFDVLSQSGCTIEVKTEQTGSEPRDNHNMMVCAKNSTQKCDAYLFVYVDYKMTGAYLIGWICKPDFDRIKKFRKKGEIQFNGFEFKEDCYTVSVNQLTKCT